MPEFQGFLQRLRRAITDRDDALVRSIASPDIRLDLGDSLGLEDLGLDDPTSPFWPRLDKALSVGCLRTEAGNDTSWECPGLREVKPPAPGSNYLEQVFILANDIALRSAAAGDAPIKARVSCQIMSVDLDHLSSMLTDQQESINEKGGWVPVVVNGRRAFIASDFAYLPTGYRAVFERRDGNWIMTAYLAGD
ncbi:hypothetical protein [Microvirga massiliensis]|uniref:hypothetical protein n=1 Tax=Microvirga massiliensis TaxID=1033741 RepID=UPI00062B9ED1|nr:hypothetical protein [Microvirga massiliensis]